MGLCTDRNGTRRAAYGCNHPEDEQDPNILLYHLLSPLSGNPVNRARVVTGNSGEPVLYVYSYFAKNRKSYFLRIAVAVKREIPIAARIVAGFAGDFCVTPAAAPEACAGAASDEPD